MKPLAPSRRHAFLTFLLMFFTASTIHAQVVVLDNAATGCAYTVQIKWGDIDSCSSVTPIYYDCDATNSSSSHNVGAGQVVNVPVPVGATGPCQIKVLSGTVTVAQGKCSVANSGFNITDCQGFSRHIDVTEAWTVKWL
jgi:hypothetical protein